MDTQTQIERLIELAIVQRGELRKLVGELPQLREHLNAEIERVFEETEPQLRVELEEFVAKQAQERTDAISAELKSKIDSFAKTLNQSAEAKYSALVAERAKNDDLLKQAEQNIAFAAQALPAQVKEIVTAELARFPRAGEIDQLRKEFAEPKGLNPRGKWSGSETYNRLDLVAYNGDSFVSNVDGNKERPSRSSESWTLNAARGVGGGGGLLSLNDALGNPSSDFTVVGAEGNNYVRKTLTAGANITITESPTAITIIGDEGQISLEDGTAAAPALFFTNDTDTGLYRPAANTLGISVSGTQVAYFDQNGLTIPAAGVVAGGSIHAANGNANNPSHSFSGDQDTGFFRHQANELGIALGGTQYATLTSATFSITPSVTVGGTLRASGGIVGTAVGASSPSTGAFTTLSASNLLSAAGASISGSNAPSSGASVEINYGQIANSGRIFAYDRSGSAFKDLYLDGATLTLRSGASATPALTINGSQNTTLAGNITVSGTGTSSFAGKIQTTSANGIEAIVGSGNTGLSLQSGTTQYSLYLNAADNSYRLYSSLGGDRFAVSSSGNFLLKSDGVDSGNGKLQLATHTTSAGGIGFGTATSLYTPETGVLITNALSGTTAGLRLFHSSAQKAQFLVDGSGLYVDASAAGGSIILRTNAGTTALTLDSSQNATFAGTVTATQYKTASGINSSVATGTPSTLFSLSGKSGQMFLVHACLVGINDANSYAAYATVVMDGTAARIVSNNGALMTITLSGTNVQATQTSGVTQQIAWKYTSL